MRTRATLFCAAALAALSLAACQKQDSGGAPEAVQAAPAAGASDAAASAPAADAAAPEAALKPEEIVGRPGPASPAPYIAQLAYRYAYEITAPAKAVRLLVDKHEQACTAAGAAVCQVIGANAEGEGRDRIHATLTLRGAPDWIARFRAALPADIEAVEGKVETSGIQTEDLSRQLVDTAAEARAQTVLRDRLQKMVAERNGKLADVLEVEQARAGAQSRIDAAKADLTGMRGRVLMSELRLTYQSKVGLAPEGVLEPLGAAAHDVTGIMVAVLAFLLRSAAVLLPVGVVGWLGWRLTRRGRPTAKHPAA